MLWDRRTGEPVHHAIVWQDTRTDAPDRASSPATAGRTGSGPRTGLPLATYFSGPKLRWLLDADPELRRRAEAGEMLFGTIDTWLIWNLTGRHVTDVTNASRTMLMNLSTLDWDDELLAAFGVPARDAAGDPCRPSAGLRRGPRRRCTGCRWPAPSAISRRRCSARPASTRGEAKCTYGTGAFLLLNTGTTPIPSRAGLITTVGYQLDDHRRCTRWRARSRSPARWSSGCATTSG